MNAHKPEKPPRMRLWLKVLFGVSLAFNIAVVGMAAGIAWRWDDHRRGHSKPPVGTMLFRELPSEQRKALWQSVRDSKRVHGANRKEDTKAVVDALKATPFDLSALEAAVVQQSRHMAEFQTSVRNTWLEQVKEMSPQERVAYADRLLEASKRSGRKRKDRDRGHWRHRD